MSSPSSDNVLIGRGIILFAPRVSGVLQGFRDLGNCDLFSLTPASEFAELANFRTSTTAPYKKVHKKTTLDCKIAGYEFDPSIIALMLLGNQETLSQSASTASSVTLVASTVTDVKGTSFQTAHRNISSVVLVQGANTLVDGDDYEITDDAAGMIRFLPTGSTVVDGTVITASYSYAAASLDVVAPASASAVEGRMVFLPDAATGPNLEHIYWNCSISPDGEQGFIAEEFAKWSATVSINDDSAGLYGGSSTYPLGKIIKRAA